METDELILNRYRPLGEVGRGGFGTVQLAWDTRIQRRVAVKCMPVTGESRAAAQRRNGADAHVPVNASDIPGLEEARTAALLQAPNIVGVLDFEIQKSTAYLIMEYVDGITLTQLLDEWGSSIDADVVAALFDGVANALITAHENAVLHLDIKPDNILINHQGLIKVTDFGLAELSSAAGYGSATGGTIGYMPPEQLNREPLDERCDEWALASVIYEMIAGENPFRAKSLAGARKAIGEAELVLPHLCMPELDPSIDDVLFYALDPDREERYASVLDFAEVAQPLMGDSRIGRKRLVEIVSQATDDTEEEPQVEAKAPLFASLSERGTAILARGCSVVSAGTLAFLGLSAIPQLSGLQNPVFWGLFALIVLASTLVTHVGALLALGSFAAALIMRGSVIAGILLALLACTWWFFAGRKSMAAGPIAASPALLGIVGLGNLAPLLAGYFLSVKDALITVAVTSLLAFLFAATGTLDMAWFIPDRFGWNLAMGYNESLVLMLTHPQTYIFVIGWIGAGAVLAWSCSRGKKVFAFLGLLASAVILVASLCARVVLTVGALQPTAVQIASVVVPLLLCVVFIALGVPERENEETYEG